MQCISEHREIDDSCDWYRFLHLLFLARPLDVRLEHQLGNDSIRAHASDIDLIGRLCDTLAVSSSRTKIRSATSPAETWRVIFASFAAGSITACKPSSGILPSPLKTRTTES